MNKKQLQTLVESVIKETDLKTPQIYESYCHLESNPDVNVMDILTFIRALRGVTIVSLKEATKRVTTHRETAEIRMKYQPTGMTVRPYMKTLTKEIHKIPGVMSFHFKSTAKI